MPELGLSEEVFAGSEEAMAPSDASATLAAKDETQDGTTQADASEGLTASATDDVAEPPTDAGNAQPPAEAESADTGEPGEGEAS
jgi:hypothetical protein